MTRVALLAALVLFPGCLPSALTPGLTPTTTAPPTSAPATTAASSPQASASTAPTASETDPYVRAVVAQWRPSGATAFVDRRPAVGQGHVIVAVPLSGGTPTDLVVTTSDAGDWDVRPDGGAIVAASNEHCVGGTCGPGAGRLAIVDLGTGRARWLTASEPGSKPSSPVWSPDGAFIYFGVVDGAGSDAGIFRIKPDGTERTRVTDPVPPAPVPFGGRGSSSRPQLVTSDGTLFWVATQSDRMTLRARDLARRTDRTFASDWLCIGALASRSSPLGALVSEGGCHTAPTRLSLWDLAAGTTRLVIDGSDIVDDATWDPDGRRTIVAAHSMTADRNTLVVFDGATRSAMAGGDGAIAVRWTSAGVTIIANITEASADCVFGIREVRFIAGGTGAALPRYRACALERLRVIAGS